MMQGDHSHLDFSQQSLQKSEKRNQSHVQRAYHEESLAQFASTQSGVCGIALWEAGRRILK